jgi:transposase
MTPIPLASHLTESEFQQRIDKEKDSSFKDKYRALLWILQGKQRFEIAKLLGVSTSIIYKWVKRYNSEGESGLRRQKGQGRKRTMTPDKVEKLKEWVNQEEGVWTLSKMRDRLLSQEGISITPQAIWYRLRESRWSWKTGRIINPQANEEEQEAFKKTD